MDYILKLSFLRKHSYTKWGRSCFVDGPSCLFYFHPCVDKFIVIRGNVTQSFLHHGLLPRLTRKRKNKPGELPLRREYPVDLVHAKKLKQSALQLRDYIRQLAPVRNSPIARRENVLRATLLNSHSKRWLRASGFVRAFVVPHSVFAAFAVETMASPALRLRAGESIRYTRRKGLSRQCWRRRRGTWGQGVGRNDAFNENNPSL